MRYLCLVLLAGCWLSHGDHRDEPAEVVDAGCSQAPASGGIVEVDGGTCGEYNAVLKRYFPSQAPAPDCIVDSRPCSRTITCPGGVRLTWVQRQDHRRVDIEAPGVSCSYDTELLSP